MQAHGLHTVSTAVAKGNVKNENNLAIPEDVQNAKDVQHVDDVTKVQHVNSDLKRCAESKRKGRMRSS